HRWLYKNTGAVPEEMYTIPLGRAQLLHRGEGATVVAASLAAVHTLEACRKCELDVDLIDPRTIKPLDMDCILESVARTGRLVVIDYDFPFGGFAAEVVARVAEELHDRLRAAPQRITFPDRGMPSSGVLERAYYPTPETIAAELEAVLGRPVVHIG
ncbi:MAG: alpha-ketoacid dehydrogenase subunit beta, partial [Planctomycetes bacterium]|nr:alpha-ketoacid dehydrogenase subunit beta [Planctomycetota bacterium]